MAKTIFTRNIEELLKDYHKATPANPLILYGNEIDLLTKWLRESNRASNKKIAAQIADKDISFKKDHVFSHADQQYYPNRQAWENHLKANNCFEVGNEYNKKDIRDRKIRGNFNCHKELTEATKQVLGRSH